MTPPTSVREDVRPGTAQAPCLQRGVITMIAGTGRGPTTMAAFDAALIATGVANFNLIRLSSVIPPATEIRPIEVPVVPPGEWGDRLYVVMAESRTETLGAEVWAGIGWVQDSRSGKGLFVEHEGHHERQVRSDISASLTAMCKGRSVGFGAQRSYVHGAICDGEPVCALVVAVYESQGWSRPPLDLG